ncbi:MAG: YqaJ viral recombinase family protein [Bacteroidota bacterium]|nr:YqaJ viral recombinase family protein [Bacteroidota bacterium]
MEGIKIHNVDQNSEEWLELRKGKVTASNAYILLKKGVNAAIAANNGESGGGFYAARGHILEEEAIEIYQEVTGKKVHKVGFITNDKYPNCGWSPDGWDVAVESKSFKVEKHLACCKELPIEVYCQVQFGMMIGELPEMDVILYNPDIEDSKLCFKIITVKRDDELIKRFEQKLEVNDGSREELSAKNK